MHTLPKATASRAYFRFVFRVAEVGRERALAELDEDTRLQIAAEEHAGARGRPRTPRRVHVPRRVS